MDSAYRSPTETLRGKTARLVLLTFLAVSLTILIAGFVIVPVVIQKVEARYLAIQSDINERQARSLAHFAELRLEEGIPTGEVQAELQALLTGADADRGYSCVINRGNAEFVCHPMTMALGMSVATKEADFQNRTIVDSGGASVPWEDAITGGVFGAGSLFYPDGGSEIVHMEAIPGTEWTVTTHENTERVRSELADLRQAMLIGAGIIGLLLAIPSSFAARAVGRRHEKRLEIEQARSEKLLLNILPQEIAERLKQDESVIADRHSDVTVLFADIVGFTPWAAQISAEELVVSLNRIFSRFDDICAEHGLEKIKTIGDAYMLCGGLDGDKETGACSVVEAGLKMIEVIRELSTEAELDSLSIRVGVHTGELVAGVIGKRKFSYDLWGDAVNTASRLESSGVEGCIQISKQTESLLDPSFQRASRGRISLKGKGEVEVWLIETGRGA